LLEERLEKGGDAAVSIESLENSSGSDCGRVFLSSVLMPTRRDVLRCEFGGPRTSSAKPPLYGAFFRVGMDTKPG